MTSMSARVRSSSTMVSLPTYLVRVRVRVRVRGRGRVRVRVRVRFRRADVRGEEQRRVALLVHPVRVDLVRVRVRVRVSGEG